MRTEVGSALRFSFEMDVDDDAVDDDAVDDVSIDVFGPCPYCCCCSFSALILGLISTPILFIDLSLGLVVCSKSKQKLLAMLFSSPLSSLLSSPPPSPTSCSR